MKVFIDLQSIKANPRVGATRTYIENGKSAKIALKIPECKSFFFKYKNRLIFLSNIHPNNARGTRQSFKLYQVIGDIDELLPDAQKLPKNSIDIQVYCHIQTINHAPEPEWLYKHKNPVIQCSNCGAKTKANDLAVDDSGELSCPTCEEMLNIECESIEEALKRRMVYS